MAAVAVTTLAEGARLRADERPGGTAAYFTDTEAAKLVRQSVCRLRRVLEAERGHELFTSTSTISTANGVSAYSLPTDLEAVLRVTADVSGTEMLMTPHELAEEPWLREYGQWGCAPAHYRIRGTSIEISPVPTSAESVTVVYATRHDTSASAYDLYLDGWDEWVERDTACDMLAIQGMAHTWQAQARDQLGEQLKRQAQDRVVEDALHVVDRETLSRVAWYPRARM